MELRIPRRKWKWVMWVNEANAWKQKSVQMELSDRISHLFFPFAFVSPLLCLSPLSLPLSLSASLPWVVTCMKPHKFPHKGVVWCNQNLEFHFSLYNIYTIASGSTRLHTYIYTVNVLLPLHQTTHLPAYYYFIFIIKINHCKKYIFFF